MPKSIAPSEMRFAGRPIQVRPMNAESIEIGTTTATATTARSEPRNSHTTRSTSDTPSSEVAAHGGERGPHEGGAVVEGVDQHARRQHVAVELLDPLVDGREDDAGMRLAPQEDDPLDHVVGVAAARRPPRRGVEPSITSATSRMWIGTEPRVSMHDVAQFPRVAERAHAADHELLRTDPAVAAARVLVGPGDRGMHIVDGDSAAVSRIGSTRTW